MALLPPEAGIFRQTFPLHYPDADAAGFVRLTALLNLLQIQAGEHATGLGFDYHDNKAAGVFWVLGRLTVRLDRRIAWPCRMTVDTWVRGTKSLFTLRDLRFGPEDGPWTGRATMAWVLLKDRRPQRPEPWMGAYTPVRIEEPAAEVPAALPVQAPHDGAEARAESLVRHSRGVWADWEDLDLNGHVNNVNGVGWCLAQHDQEFLTRHTPEVLEVNFLAEMFCGQKFQVLTDERPETGGKRTFDYQVVRESDQVPTLRMRITFS